MNTPADGSNNERFARAIAAIDAANGDDPNEIVVRGERRPKELAHAELVTEYVHRLDPTPSEALLLAARAHHLRRWVSPRSSFPAGRASYLRWRRELHAVHAEAVGEILIANGYDDATIGRVKDLVFKRGLGTDPEVQVLEDALCLTFLETQFHDVAARLEPGKLVGVVRKTLKKMSPAAIAIAPSVGLSPADWAVIEAAAAPDPTD
jgi:hypothetical protein